MASPDNLASIEAETMRLEESVTESARNQFEQAKCGAVTVGSCGVPRLTCEPGLIPAFATLPP